MSPFDTPSPDDHEPTSSTILLPPPRSQAGADLGDVNKTKIADEMLSDLQQIADCLRSDGGADMDDEWYRDEIARLIGCRSSDPDGWAAASVSSLEHSRDVVSLIRETVAASCGTGWHAIGIAQTAIRRNDGNVMRARKALHAGGDGKSVMSALEQGNPGTAAERLRSQRRVSAGGSSNSLTKAFGPLLIAAAGVLTLAADEFRWVAVLVMVSLIAALLISILRDS